MANEFENLSKSNALDTALNEPDFVKKAIRLFSLREEIHTNYKQSKQEIADTLKGEARERSRKPGRIGYCIGLSAGLTAGFFLFGPASIAGFIFGLGIPALIGGSLFRGITRGWVHIGADVEIEQKTKDMETKRGEMLERVETTIAQMDKSLAEKTSFERDQFREAFKHAALKQAIRENKLGSKAGIELLQGAAAPELPDLPPPPDPDITTDDPVKAMKTLKIRAGKQQATP